MLDKKAPVMDALEKKRNNEIDPKEYFKVRREYRQLQKKEKEEEGERRIKGILKDKPERKFWERVNMKRNKRERIDDTITDEEWLQHFRNQLGEQEEKPGKGLYKKKRWEGKQFTKEELEKVLKKMKKKKACGMDGIDSRGELERLKKGVERLESLCIEHEETIKELKRKQEGKEVRLEDYSDQETLEDGINNNRKNVPDKNGTKEEEIEKSEEEMDTESRERKIRGKIRLVVRKGIAWNGRYVESWMKEVTGEDFEKWTIEGLCKKGQSKAYGAWVLETDSKEIEEKLLRERHQSLEGWKQLRDGVEQENKKIHEDKEVKKEKRQPNKQEGDEMNKKALLFYLQKQKRKRHPIYYLFSVR
ncbi:hypothetical protein QAD02_002555 [Eretmocerus hayati]|uniref:Uncharacterized protein n=1 Tax=Eretmocerus hayati TaxID=131215 RepID=A0ACC2NK55_9HYME|nr:hypothetical protein QAD02_002555 [Eretmocerus hayati]